MLICGRSPFASGGANETLTHIMDGRYDISSHVSENCKRYVEEIATTCMYMYMYLCFVHRAVHNT